MGSITIIDDDYAMEILAETLTFAGHNVERISTAERAIAELERIVESDLVILDLIMEPPPGATAVSGGMATGMTLFSQLRAKKPQLQIIINTALSDSRITTVIDRDPFAVYRSKWSAPTLDEFVGTISAMLGVQVEPRRPRAFIVHGRDESTKLQLKNYLQNTIGLDEPVILHEQPSQGRTIIEKFEHFAATCDLAFVLLTPDDLVGEPGAPNEEKRRARQNVIFELGYFLSALGRLSGRVFLLHKGPIELPSDINGLIYVDIASGVEAAGEKIRRELHDVF